MHLYGVYSSTSESCGISIFNSHLKKSIYRFGFELEPVNLLSNANRLKNGMKAILHYVPSGFATEQNSKYLINLLQTVYFEKLIVIFHGVYLEGENRFVMDTQCPYQKEQLELIFRKSFCLVALSKSVELNLKTWLLKLRIKKTILTLDHPGLFNFQPSFKESTPFVFLGGIYRAKKNYKNKSTVKLIEKCIEQRIPIWMHWANLVNTDYNETIIKNVWRLTNGLISDQGWCNIIANSRVILCPYETQIQSVSGIIAEAISTHSYILSTGFDYAIEMQKRYPSLIFINNDIEHWADLIKDIISLNRDVYFNYYNWGDFANDLLTILVESQECILV